MNVEELVRKCCEKLDLSSENKAVRQFLQCFLTEAKIRHIVVDNGLRYNFLVYIEACSKSELRDIIEVLEKSLEHLAKNSPGNLGNYVLNKRVLDWGSEIYLLLSKEFVVVKYVIK